MSIHSNTRCKKQKEQIVEVTGHVFSNNRLYFHFLYSDNSVKVIEDLECDTTYEKYIKKYIHDKKINTKTVYIIIRVSTKNQDSSNSYSMDIQETELRNNVPSIYRKKIIRIVGSAYKRIPSEISSLEDVLLENDSIFVYRVDRLGRNVSLFLPFLDRLNEKNINIVSLKRSYNSSINEPINFKDNRLLFIELLLDAEKESYMIANKSKATINKKRENGDYIGTAPFGKEVLICIDGTRVLCDNKHECDIIRFVYERNVYYINLSLTKRIDMIYQELHDLNVKTQNGKTVSKYIIKKIIKNKIV